MLALGAVLTGAAFFILAMITPIFRRPQPPRWTRATLVGELVTVAIVTVMTVGAGSLAVGVFHTVKGDEPLLDLAAFGGLVVLSGVFLRWRRARLASGAPALAALGPAANDTAGGSSQPTTPKPRRRAA